MAELMYRRLILSLLFVLFFHSVFSGEIRGRITDSQSGEELIGSTILIKELNKGTITGLDGTFIIREIPAGTYTVICSYMGYRPVEQKITSVGSERLTLDLKLIQNSEQIHEVTIIGHGDKGSEISARNSEKRADQVMNVVSARTIELSPDLQMASVIQRISGITLDKQSSGTGQYALLRGMDKRYNYTLINGVKIPSTHNKHRYVSLDMFPADMVDRVEVSKALTPNMEGDAIAGAVNLVMKSAPEQLLIQANASMGFSQFFLNNHFQTFDTRVLNVKSPYERNEKGYRATPADFNMENLVIQTKPLPLDYYGNLTVGRRFLKNKLGVILSGSLMNTKTGESSTVFDDDLSRDGKNLPVLTSMRERIYSDNKKNLGVHNKLDYRFNSRHRLQLYTAFLELDNTQVREVQSTNLAVSYDPDKGNLNRSHSTRLRLNQQSLLNTTLIGDHQISPNLAAQWSAVFSRASNRTPEEATVPYTNSTENFIPVKQFVDFDGSDRIWRRNSDEDKAGYLNFTYTPTIFGIRTELIAGGMYRDKQRTSFYNKYTLNAIVKVNNADTSFTSFYSEKGVDWNTYDEITWQVYNPRGTVAVGENYDAFETVKAGFGMFRFTYSDLQVTGGARIENTLQGYYMKYPIGEPNPEGNQSYTDLLPSVHLKYSLLQKHNIRLSYYRAINKPGFQEIVPYIDASDEPRSAGNKNLKHAVADNLDLRWEFFPAPLDQVMVGLFYKNIKDPIEFAFDKFMNISQQIVYTPINSDQAINKGFEIDIIKFVREWGIKANYTLTRSSITTQKLSRVKDAFGNDSTAYVPQTRPLFGQSAQVGNLSLIYKGSKNGISAQMALSYTGDRIYTVSRYIDNDLWQKGFWQMDMSVEKKFRNGLCLFLKAHNILNSHVIVYIKNKNPLNNDVPFQSEQNKYTLVRDEYNMPAYLVGIRYKFQ